MLVYTSLAAVLALSLFPSPTLAAMKYHCTGVENIIFSAEDPAAAIALCSAAGAPLTRHNRRERRNYASHQAMLPISGHLNRYHCRDNSFIFSPHTFGADELCETLGSSAILLD